MPVTVSCAHAGRRRTLSDIVCTVMYDEANYPMVIRELIPRRSRRRHPTGNSSVCITFQTLILSLEFRGDSSVHHNETPNVAHNNVVPIKKYSLIDTLYCDRR